MELTLEDGIGKEYPKNSKREEYQILNTKIHFLSSQRKQDREYADGVFETISGEVKIISRSYRDLIYDMIRMLPYFEDGLDLENEKFEF